ncbi:hypothetical protein IAI10_02050 [Clostridium sp. 19966]|uniref:hypothetical protein n=1 Tax=Clostridium sp. 19966 TaxID=2768166 RepID=UPI0028E07D02|nr:hypothetical protein [Clostridium sp. 19966]MDT8715439.1 hypothetical protein [Clostridium sp. 19966]
MVNIKPLIASLLSEIPGITVSFIYPKDFSQLPAVAYKTENKAYKVSDGEEIMTEWILYIDVWHNLSTSEAISLIDEKMTTVGFERQLSGDIAEVSGLNHNSMRFHGIVDNKNLLVYQS